MVDQIRDTQVVQTPEIAIDPVFFLPPNVIGISTKNRDGDPNYSSEGEIDLVVDGSGAGSESDYEQYWLGTFDTMYPPQQMNVVSQTVRFGPDGRAVVDVVVEIDDVPGAINYEARITKASY